MAQYKTKEEAGAALSAELYKKANELKSIYDSKDPKDVAKADKLKSEIGAIQNQLMINSGGVGAFGGGLAKGVSSVVTALPDIGIMAKNFFSSNQTPTLGDRLTPGLESVSQDRAALFGLGRGIGSSFGLGPTMAGLNIGANVADETVFGGTPVAQTALGIGALSKGGFDLFRNALKSRQVNKLLAQLPDEESALFKDLMVRGQTSSDPVVAGKIAALRSNPKYAEIFNVLEKQATEAATAGARPVVNPNYPAKSAGQDIYMGVKGEVDKLKENIKTLPASRYAAAAQMGGNNDIIMTDNVIKNIDNMILDFGRKGTDDARSAQAFLGRLRENILESGGRISVEKLQALTTEFGQQAKQGEQLITDVSLGSQKRIASAIFGGLKDDLKLTAQESTVPRIRELSRILESAVDMSSSAYNKYNSFIAQGLPSKLRNMDINAVDTETILGTVKGLTNDQRAKMTVMLENTQPEALKRIRQVMYDDFVQGARTELPDGSMGVDLKLLAQKYSKLNESDKEALAFSLGSTAKDFDERMGGAIKYFNYMQKYGKTQEGQALSPAQLAELSTAGYVTGGYGVGKAVGLLGRMWNSVKNGLNDDEMMNILLSPETKTLLRDAIKNPNSVETLTQLEQSIFKPTGAVTQGANVLVRGLDGLPSNVAPVTGQQFIPERPALDLTAPVEPTQQQQITPGERPTLDLSYNPAEIEQQIRAEADRQGLGKYSDLFVRQAKQESGFNPYATSKAGAGGIFQHMPATAQELGIDPYDTTQSIQGGIKYMGQLLNRYQGDPTKALAAYNWGMGNLDRQGLQAAPAETQNYLKNILG